MADDFLELVGRKASLLGGGRHRVAGRGVGLAEGSDGLLDLLGAEADLGGEVLNRRVAGHLTQDSIE
jgi:hypothetical protein